MKADHTMKICRQAFDQLVEEVAAGRSDTLIGLEMGSSSSDYISLYNGKKEDLLQSVQRIQRTASEILEAITQEEPLAVTVKAA